MKINVISIHSPRMGRDLAHQAANGFFHISIHSPRMGRDDINKQLDYHDYISIHSPRMGRDIQPREGA